MKRISKEKFVSINETVGVTGIRIRDGEFYWVCNIEESENAERVFAAYRFPVQLDRNDVFEAELDVKHVLLDSSVVTYVEKRPEDENICETMLSLMRPYERNGISDPDDYDIFILSKEEFVSLCDTFRDGDYIFILEGAKYEPHQIENDIAAKNNLSIGDTLYYAYDDFDGSGVVEGKIVGISSEMIVMKDEYNTDYCLLNEWWGDNAFLTREAAEKRIGRR